MSNVIDERILKMEFDNKDFESNVQTTIQTLGRLKSALSFSNDTAEGMGDLDASVSNVSSRFSALEIIGITALTNITNSAVNAGKRIVKALTIQPITSGYSEYETQIKSIQTILANTQKEGTTITQVNKALDTLNTYADKTIYNFTEMARNIGTFTAAGVKLQTSVDSIQGIANLAAVSGSTSQQASTAMYQLSQAIATGTVRLMDWNSVVNAGMGGQVFQDALIRTSEHLNTGAKAAIKAQGSFRESLSTGWLTTEVLTKTLKQFALNVETAEDYEKAVKSLVAEGYTQEEAKNIADMAKTAGDAATKVKTFTQLIDTLKEALGSGWAQSWRIIIGDFEEARSLWTKVSDILSKSINDSANARNKLLTDWDALGGRTALIKSLSNVFKGLSSITKQIKGAFNDIFPSITAKKLNDITTSLQKLTSGFKLSKEQAEDVKNTFRGLFSVVNALTDVILMLGKVLGKVLVSDGVRSLLSVVIAITGAIGDFVAEILNQFKSSGLGGFISSFGTEFSKALSAIADSVWGFIDTVSPLTGVLELISDTLVRIAHSISASFSRLRWSDIMLFLAGLELTKSAKKAYEMLTNVENVGEKFTHILRTFSKEVTNNVVGTLEALQQTMVAYQTSLHGSALMKIASAIALLSLSLAMLAEAANPDKGYLDVAIVYLSFLMVVLVGCLKWLNSFEKSTSSLSKKSKGKSITERLLDLMFGTSKNLVKTASAATTLLSFAGAIGIISYAAAQLGKMKWQQILAGIGGLAVMLGGISLFIYKVLPKLKQMKKFATFSKTLIVLGVALNVMALAIKQVAALDPMQLTVGLAGLLIPIFALTNYLEFSKGFSLKKFSDFSKTLIVLGVALNVMALAITVVAALNPEQLCIGLIGLAVAIGGIYVLATNMGKFKAAKFEQFSKQLVVLGVGLNIIGLAIAKVGSLGVSTALVGILALAGAIVILTKALQYIGNPSFCAAIATGTAYVISVSLAIAALGAALYILAEGLKAMKPIFKAVFNWIKEALVMLRDLLSVFANSRIVKLITEKLSPDLSNDPQFNNTYRGIGEAAGTSFSEGLSSSSPKAKNAGKTVSQSAKNGSKTDLTAEGKKAGTGFASGIGSDATLDKLKKQAGQLSSTVKKETKVDLTKQGEYAGQGLANGLSNKKGAVKDASKKLADLIPKKVSKLLNEHSPSRVMFGLGDYATQGFILGLEEKMDRVSKISEEMAESVTTGPNSLTSMLVDSLSNIEEYQPTVKPIVDMSNVNASASAMNSIFGRGTSVPISGTLSSANAVGSINRSSLASQEATIETLAEKMAKKMSDSFAEKVGDTNHTFNFNIPFDINGREVAKSIATYTQDELNKLESRSNRQLGLI